MNRFGCIILVIFLVFSASAVSAQDGPVVHESDPGPVALPLTVPVPHDLENAALAAVAALALGVPGSTIEEAMATYPGLPRRMQPIATGPFLVIDSMMNDPVLTALGPALAAISCESPIVALVGERAPTSPLSPRRISSRSSSFRISSYLDSS